MISWSTKQCILGASRSKIRTSNIGVDLAHIQPLEPIEPIVLRFDSGQNPLKYILVSLRSTISKAPFSLPCACLTAEGGSKHASKSVACSPCINDATCASWSHKAHVKHVRLWPLIPHLAARNQGATDRILQSPAHVHWTRY